MRRRVGLACAALLLLLTGLFWTARPALLPQDLPVTLALPEARALRITLLGTSLSHEQVWPERLRRRLEDHLNHPVVLGFVTRPGAGSRWGQGQVQQVVAQNPDWVLVEFAINDADIRDGQNLDAAQRSHVALLQDLQKARPEAAIVLMTMSPAQGLRGLLRPCLGAHYRQYRTLAERFELGLVDLYPRWLALPAAARGLQADGLHPEPQVAATLIVPILLDYLLQGLGLSARP